MRFESYPVEKRGAGKPTVIYGLCDPRSGELRYVGKTVAGTHRRRKQHIGDARRGISNGHSGNWVRLLLAAGVEPEIFEIETVPVGGDWVEAEAHWIATMRAIGCELTNLAEGGQGTDGYRFTDEQRQKLSESHAHQRRTPEQIERWKVSMAAKRANGWTMPPFSEEAIQKRKESAAKTNAAGLRKKRRPATDEQRRRASEARIACDTPEMRARISAGKLAEYARKRQETGSAISPEVRQKLSDAMKRKRAEMRQEKERAAQAIA